MAKRYIVHSGDRELSALLTESEGGYTIELDGVVYHVDAHNGSGESPTRSILIDGKSYETATFPGRDGLDVFISGDAFHMRIVDELWARAESDAHGGAGGETVVSPMPGAVVKVLVEAGETVEPGRPVVIVEAMKMQNELTAAKGGKVVEIKVKPGDVVEQDAVLVVMAPAEG